MSTPAASDKNSPYFQAIVPGKTHVLAYTNTAADIDSDFQAETTLLQIFCTTDCWILIKESGDAASAVPVASGASGDSYFIPGGITCFIGLPFFPDKTYNMSVVRDSANGRIYITEAV